MPRSAIALVFRRALVGVCVLLLAVDGSSKPGEKPSQKPTLPVTAPSTSKPPRGKPCPPRPSKPYCRRLEPCTVTYRDTGTMNWEPWKYTVLPCDYGERFVDPIDKTCRTAKDCVMITVPWDCCGSLFLTGINKRMVKQYVCLNHACRRVLKWCDCPPGDYHAEDFRTTADPGNIRLGCVRGMCRTFLTRPGR